MWWWEWSIGECCHKSNSLKDPHHLTVNTAINMSGENWNHLSTEPHPETDTNNSYWQQTSKVKKKLKFMNTEKVGTADDYHRLEISYNSLQAISNVSLVKCHYLLEENVINCIFCDRNDQMMPVSRQTNFSASIYV